MSTTPVLFDMSKAKPIQSDGKPVFDMSKAKPIQDNSGQPAPRSAEHPSDQWSNNKHYVSAAPRQPVRDWLNSVQTDLRSGGSRTVVGRTLGKMQGRDNGYEGLESGVSPQTADFMGSVPLGAVETARGVAETRDHPIRGMWQAVEGAGHMTETPGMFVGGPAAEAGVEAGPALIRKALDKLPTATRGASRLNEVEQAAGHLPVELNRAHDELIRAKQLFDTGATMPEAVKKLLKRYQNPKGTPIQYSEARDFYSNLSLLSADELTKMTPPMKRQVGLIVEALRNDIGDTAASVDKASIYYAGLKDYARAKRYARIGTAIGDALKSHAVKTAVGAGAGYAAVKAIGKEF